MFSTNGTSVLSFQNIYKLYTSVLKNHHIYSINTYTCPGYSCEILVEISLYFDLQEINKFIATYRGRYLSEIYLFCVAQNSTYFLQNFYRTFGICIYMWVFNFNLKKIKNQKQWCSSVSNTLFANHPLTINVQIWSFFHGVLASLKKHSIVCALVDN
jgi:hypothetical protein